ncbi:MAG TPA: hypothetical protein VEE82_01075, partial [Thermodesulfovibrionales bacterium]|nr:hypothetical protein [Thermodesulfovibrionales bacterium]
RSPICMLLLLMSSTAFATSIVAVRNNDEIVIAADSKTILTPVGDSVGEPESVAKCKIVQAGNLFFASAGSAGIGSVEFDGNVDSVFNLKEVIAKGLAGEGRIVDKVNNLEKVLVITLAQIAEKARQDNVAFFMERFIKYPIHSVIIAGLDNEELVLMVRTFKLIISPSGSLSFEIGRFACPGDCQAPFVTIFEGQTEAIRKFLQENEYFLYYTDPTIAVRNLVELEVSKDPSFVGPPIDILRLTREGAEWIQRKSLCRDIQNNSILPEEVKTDNPLGFAPADR